MPYRMRDPAQIAEEFEAADQPYPVFIDNNLGSNREYLRSLCTALRPLEKIWSAAVSIDITDDPTLIRAMALGGCTGVFVGFESLTDENLADAGKKTPKTADYARRVHILHDNGIQVNSSFVPGFDHDRKDVFERTADWVEENRLECSTFHILTPYPATPLFRQMEAEGRLLHQDWSLCETGHAVFRPKNMSPEELEQGYAWIYRRLFSHASIWKRRPEDWRAVAPYIAMSYLGAAATLISLDLPAARVYASLRADRSLSAPDAVQLACAASVGVDLFITNDARLQNKIIAGIQFIVPLDRVPL